MKKLIVLIDQLQFLRIKLYYCGYSRSKSDTVRVHRLHVF